MNISHNTTISQHIEKIYSLGLYVVPAQRQGQSLPGANYRQLADNPPTLEEALDRDYSGGLLILLGTRHFSGGYVTCLEVDGGPPDTKDWRGFPLNTVYVELGTEPGKYHIFVITRDRHSGVMNLRDINNPTDKQPAGDLVAEIKGFGQTGIRSWPTMPPEKPAGYTPYFFASTPETSPALTGQQYAEGLAHFLSNYPHRREVRQEVKQPPRQPDTRTVLNEAGRASLHQVLDAVEARGLRIGRFRDSGWASTYGQCLFCGHKNTMGIHQDGGFNCMHASCGRKGGLKNLAEAVGLSLLSDTKVRVWEDAPFPITDFYAQTLADDEPIPGEIILEDPDGDGGDWDSILSMDPDALFEEALPERFISEELRQAAKQKAAEWFPYSNAPEDAPYVVTFMSMPKKEGRGGQMRRTMVMSNTWLNPTNRQAKKRQAFVHFWPLFIEAGAMYTLDVPKDDWTRDNLASRLSAQDQKKAGHHLLVDLGTAHGIWRLITTYPFKLGARRKYSPKHEATEVTGGDEGMALHLLNTIDAIDPGNYDSRSKRVRFYWSCQDWALRRAKDQDKFHIVAVKDGECNDAAEVAVAEERGFTTTTREAVDDGDHVGWGQERWFFAPTGMGDEEGDHALLSLIVKDFDGYKLTDRAYGMVFGEDALQERKERMAVGRAQRRNRG